MRTVVGKRSVMVVAVVIAWRAASELVERRRLLDRSGELERRLSSRRAGALARALERSGVRSRERAAVPVGVHGSVHVGAVGGADVDDVGLLEAAMRRSTLVRAGAWQEASVAAPDHRAGTVPLHAMLLAVAGVALTLVPLVRPLADGAPWLAGAGISLVVVACLSVRRR